LVSVARGFCRRDSFAGIGRQADGAEPYEGNASDLSQGHWIMTVQVEGFSEAHLTREEQNKLDGI
jgi:hypothetical protein